MPCILPGVFEDDFDLLAFVRRFDFRSILISLALITGLFSLLSAFGYMYSVSNPEVMGDNFQTSLTNISDQNLDSSQLVFDIAGAVNKPGTYSLPPDSRIVDAVRLAGGFSADADTIYIAKVLNLSEYVANSQKIYVPFEGEASTSLNVDERDSSTESTPYRDTGFGMTNVGGLVSINSASQSELEELPSIGEKRAGDIIDGRPYVSINDLVSNDVISQGIFDDIKDDISL